MKQIIIKITLLCLTVLFALACNENKQEVAQKVAPKEIDKKVYSDWIKTDSVSTVYFTHEIDGNIIKAVLGTRDSLVNEFYPVTYHITKDGVTSVIETEYYNFFASALEGQTDAELTDSTFMGGIPSDERVPFTFFDVNFDGKKEFLVKHYGHYDLQYYVYERNKKGIYVLRQDEPYDKLFSGYNTNIDFNAEKKEITINYGDASTAYSHTYTMLNNGTRRFVYTALDTLVHPDEDTYDTYHYKIKGNKRELVSIKKG